MTRRPPSAHDDAASHRSRLPARCAGAIAVSCAAVVVLIPNQVSYDTLRAANVQAVTEAAIAIDASSIENSISPRLYGQFAEFMFENIKFGLHAELLRNRGFEETASVIGLPRHWERHPDDRNDDGIRFGWDAAVAYPAPSAPASPK